MRRGLKIGGTRGSALVGRFEDNSIDPKESSGEQREIKCWDRGAFKLSPWFSQALGVPGSL